MKLAFFRRWEVDKLTQITIDTWIYGNIAKYGGDENETVFANLKVVLPEKSTIKDLLEYLKMPTEERGITFINGDLSAMVGLQPDLTHVLYDNDRVAFFSQGCHVAVPVPVGYQDGR